VVALVSLSTLFLLALPKVSAIGWLVEPAAGLERNDNDSVGVAWKEEGAKKEEGLAVAEPSRKVCKAPMALDGAGAKGQSNGQHGAGEGKRVS
jgi:hypothetical protein